ncbi:MAG: hypothetical protein PVI01_10570 [Gemmatimonadales bacterium]|jgi:hypothetical protein
MGPWDPAVIGPIAAAIMVMSITAGIAGVMIFRPFTKQLGELLEQMRRDRQQEGERLDTTRVAEVMESVVDRLERLESRQDFTERVVESAGWQSEAGGSLPGAADAQRRDRAGDT